MGRGRKHNTIPKTGFIHESSLQGIADGTIEPFKKERATPKPTYTVGHIKIHPLVWAKAMEIADGNAHRIEVIHSEEVIVHNSKEWRNARESRIA